MPIEIQIEPKEPAEVAQPATPPPEKETKLKMNLKIRKTLDGSLIIIDHPDIDIVVETSNMKVVAYPKNEMNDDVYATQSRLFDYLVKDGVIVRDSIRGGNVYGALEGKVMTPTKEIAIDQIMIFAIGKFIEAERPSFMYEQELERRADEEETNPDDENSTDLGEVPHEEEKGSIVPHRVRRYIAGF